MCFMTFVWPREPAIYVRTIVVCLGRCENEKEYGRRGGEGRGGANDDNESERAIGKDGDFPKIESTRQRETLRNDGSARLTFDIVVRV